MSRILVQIDRVSFDRAVEIASQTKEVGGYLINDLIYHYGCEIVYELQKLGPVVADMKLCDTHNNVKNAITTLLAGGASLISIQHDCGFSPPKNLLPYCIESYVSKKPLLTFDSAYPYIMCLPSQLKHIKEGASKKICVYRQKPLELVSDLAVVHWSKLLVSSLDV